LNGTATIVGFGFTLSALAQGLILIRAGRFSDNSGRRAALLIGFTMISIGLGFLIFATTTWMFLLSMLFFGLGGAFGGTGAALVGDVIKGRSGKVIAIFQMAGDAGMMVGPILLGYISDISSYRTAFATTALAFSIAILLAARLPETRNLVAPQDRNQA
jgi:MFS family permease